MSARNWPAIYLLKECRRWLDHELFLCGSDHAVKTERMRLWERYRKAWTRNWARTWHEVDSQKLMDEITTAWRTQKWRGDTRLTVEKVGKRIRYVKILKGKRWRSGKYGEDAPWHYQDAVANFRTWKLRLNSSPDP